MRFHTDWAQPWAAGLVRSIQDWLTHRCPLVTRRRLVAEVAAKDTQIYRLQGQVQSLGNAVDALEQDLRRMVRIAPPELGARDHFSTDLMGRSNRYVIEVRPLSRHIVLDGPYGEVSPFAQHIIKTGLQRDWAEAAGEACDDLFARIQRRAA